MSPEIGFDEICSSHDLIPNRIPASPTIDLQYDDLEKDSLLGMGGSAQVYRAAVEAPEIDTIALKEPHLGGTDDKQIIELFANEAELWSYLEHDHITSVIDWGTEPHPWIALEYADNGTLADHIGQQNLEHSLWVGICIANAVKYAHTRGVVHLDLKPQNILYHGATEGTWSIPKVTDWGMAKLLLKYTGEIEGLSFHYAAPEQLRPEEYQGADEKTDVYQLGGVVYALLTGRPPVSGSQREMVDATLAGDIDPPSSVNPSLPNSLDPPIMRALQTDPADRYEDVLLIRRALERAFLDVYSIENCPQPRVNRRRTGVVGASGPTAAVGTEWKVTGSFKPAGSPAVVDDLVYLTTRQGTVHVFSVHSGSVHGGAKLSETPLTPPVVRNNQVHICDKEGMVYSVAPDGDSSSWQIAGGHSIQTPPVFHDGNIIVTSADGVIMSIDPPGTIVWETSVSGKVHGASAIRGKQLFVPTYDGLVVLDIETGSQNWVNTDATPFSTAPAAVGETVYVSGRNMIAALETESGDYRWQFRTDDVPTGLAVTPSTCYVSTKGGELLALDTTSGSTTWSNAIGNLELTAPIVGDTLVFVGCSGPGRKSLPPRMDDVYAIDLKTGSARWTFATDDEVGQSPVITGDSLLVADSEGNLYSLN